MIGRLAVACMITSLGLGAAHAYTTEVAPLAPELMVDHWTVDDGLPLDHMAALALASDGTLWIASADGLARFDGDRFTVLRRATHPELPSNRFFDVVALPDGQVWAGSEDGALVRADGDLRVYLPGRDLAGRVSRFRTYKGALWATTTAGLVKLDGVPGAADPNVIGDTVVFAPDGTRWSGGSAGVFRSRPGGVAELVVARPDGDAPPRMITADGDGTIWVGSSAGIYAIRDGVVQPITVVGEGPIQPCGYARRPDGRLELRTLSGWWRIEDGTLRQVHSGTTYARIDLDELHASWAWRFFGNTVLRGDEAVFESSERISEVLATPDGSIWIATIGAGLFRLRPRAVTMLPVPATWLEHSVEALLIGRRGELWIGSIAQGLAMSAPHDAAGATELPIDLPIERPYFVQGHSVYGFVEVDGAIEVGTSIGRCLVRPGTASCVPWDEPWRLDSIELITPLLVDHGGRTWFSAGDAAAKGGGRLIVRRREGQAEIWHEVLAPGGEGIMARAAAEGLDDDIFIATNGQGIARIHGDTVRRLTTADGLTSDRVRSLYIDPRRVVWIGTEDAGLCRWVQATDQVGCVGVGQGMVDDVVHAIVPDVAGRLWFNGNRGISWARRDAIEAVIEGRASDVLAVGLDERDGMNDREGNGILPHSSAVDGRGRILFPTQDGVAVVDPGTIPMPDPPRVELVSIAVAGRAVPRSSLEDGALTLTSDERALAVAWTAPALGASDELRFRYRLMGVSDQWSRPGRDRRAEWLNIPPGELVLEVDVGLAGAWSAAPMRLVITRAPTFVETPWFTVSIVAVALALAALGTIAWSRRQRAARAHLEIEIAHRTADLAEANRDLAARNADVAAHAARVTELNRARTRFIADLSHELRTPLALVIGPLDDLAGKLAGAMDASDHQRVALIRGNVERLEVLNDQLLDVARLEADRLPIKVRCLDLGAFLVHSVARFHDVAERKGLRLEVRVPEGAAPIYFDADLIDKVVANLVGNALKFTERGAIDVALEAADDVARVTVRDTGVGVPAAAQARVFERFYQVDRGDARRYEGVGIGLALVRDLVTLHGGDVGMTSTPGAGSAFWFELPCGAAHIALEDIDLRPALIARATPIAVDADDEARPDVLVVEDHPDMRAYLVSHLRERFAVREADGGVAALAAVRERAPSAIVSDVMMPGMDGLALCRALRADPATRHIPIVLVSAKASEDDRVTGLALADDYVTKPIRPRELIARVSRLIPSTPMPAPSPSPSPSPAPSPSPTPEPEPDDDLDLPAPELDAIGARHLARIDATVMAELCKPSFGVTELASALAMSRRQLQREVRRLTGRSPVQYLRAARMSTARDLLRAGARDTVAEVAADVGMSPAYFSRIYMVWFGVAPSDDLRPR